jgi:glycosyltransferase involved in cell wall biosynthesis
MSDLRSSGGGSAVRNSLGIREIDLPSRVFLRETRFGWSRPRVVLAQNALNFISNSEASHLAGGSFAFDPKQQLRRLLSSVAIRRAERTVCLTHAMKEIVLQSAPRAGETLVVSPVTVPTDVIEFVRANQTPRLGETGLFHVGGILRYKRLETLILALALSERERKIIDLIGASTPYLNDLNRLANSVGVTIRNEHWTREKLFANLGRASTVVATTSIESLGFPVSEAAVLGCRVLATGIPAHRELAERLSPLRIEMFDVGDVEGLAGLLDEPDVQTRTLPTEFQLQSWNMEWRDLKAVILRE